MHRTVRDTIIIAIMQPKTIPTILPEVRPPEFGFMFPSVDGLIVVVVVVGVEADDGTVARAVDGVV